MCAGNEQEARALWEPGKFQLLLLDTGMERDRIIGFAREIRRVAPSQQIAYFSGVEGRLSGSPAQEHSGERKDFDTRSAA